MWYKSTFWAIINKLYHSGLKTFIGWEGTKAVSRIIRTPLEYTMSRTFVNLRQEPILS